MTIFHASVSRRVVVVGLLIVMVGFAGLSEPLRGNIEELIRWAEVFIERSPRLGMLVFVLLAMGSALVAFFSSALLVPIAVHAWGGGICLLLLWVGWLLGGIVSFCIGRYLGRGVAAALVGADKLAMWQQRIGERARFRHVLVFQAIVPSEIPGYVLGVLRYPFWLYLAALALMEAPYALAVVYLGESFLRGDTLLLVVAGLVLIVVGSWPLRRD